METEYHFGFDPVTEEHKVICLWQDYDRSNILCDVLTLGQNIWRRIDDQVPSYHGFIYGKSSVYSSGCIYWSNVYGKVPSLWRDVDVDEVLVVFDVGREKFRVISVPNLINDQPRDTAIVDKGSVFDLLEVDGGVAILRSPISYIVKLWIFDDDHGDSNKSNTNTATSSNKNWTEVAITLPFSPGETLGLHFHTIPGTCQIILGTYEISKFDGYCRHQVSSMLLYIYDWKEKSSKRVKIDGIPSSTRYLHSACITGLSASIGSSVLYAPVALFTTFVESLWSARKQGVPCNAKPLNQ
ncbi:hypothetical protein MKW92_001821, partial [Papaver armeniacum]